MSGVLNVTVGDVDGVPTVVLAIAGVHKTDSEIGALTLHVFDAVVRAIKLLDERGTPVDVVVMDGRIKEEAPPKKRGRKPKPVDKSV
jgi:hypothetical protein